MKPTIVLLGDWYIDENWLISPQELYHSAATGKIHYLARHQTTSEKITNLCASAALLETIKSYLSKNLNDVTDFLAYGAWNPEDDFLIRRILCRINQEEMHLSPYTLSNSSNRDCEHCFRQPSSCEYWGTLVNLATAADRESVSTNRTIRCFQGHGGAMPEQLYRFDWILPLHLPDERYERIRADVAGRNVEAVIVIDHGTGVVNEASIGQLIRSVKKQALWFVRTKIADPPWMHLLRKKRIKLEMNVVDFRLAARAKGGRRWWYNSHLGRAALEMLGEMTGSHTYQDGRKHDESSIASRNAVVFLDSNTAFGMAQTGRHEEYRCVSLSQPPGEKQIINLGRTTIFCAALFAQRLRATLSNETGLTPSERLGWECSQALLCAHRWSKHASQKWSREEFSLYDDYHEALSEIRNIQDAAALPPAELRTWKESDYDEQWAFWNDSSANLGIVHARPNSGTKPRDVLQLWRGEGILKGYICVGGPKRTAINHLVSTIDNFRVSGWKHSLSCLVTSPPGWGKSFLAKSLALHFDMEFLEFSIAQMCNNHDVMDSFATIASAQSKSQKPTLVFMDEVNAPIEGHSVLPLLLSPLWGGTFVKDRQSLRLRPSVWIFASTASASKFKTEDKGSDFLSRLNGPIIELDSGRQHWADAITKIRDQIHSDNAAEWDEYKASIFGLDEYKKFRSSKIDFLNTEQVYLLVSLLNSRWGPISRVELHVLELFRDLLPINGSRSLEIFTACFEGIQRGEVRTANVPALSSSAELRRHIVIPSGWSGESDQAPQFVDIETRII